MHSVCENILQRLKSGELTRLLAYGSSNTQRRLVGMHWFDCVELALVQNCGRFHRCFSTGVGGDTARDLLARFEDDAALFRPHAVFITIGGNDCHPDQNIDEAEFEANLVELWNRFDRMGTGVIFQTYYALISDGSEQFRRFYRFSDVVRKVASDTGACLIDHLRRWEPLRREYPQIYLPLMADPFHVLERGNKVMGVDIARKFGLEMQTDFQTWAEALQIQQLMDRLESDGRMG